MEPDQSHERGPQRSTAIGFEVRVLLRSRASTFVCTIMAAAIATACSRSRSSEADGATYGPVDTPRSVPTANSIPLSQEGTVSQRIGTVHVLISYSRPVARGRSLFGKVVKFDRAWSPGANQATRIHVSHNLRVNGSTLPAGTYSLWMIPRLQQPWSII